MRDYLPAFLEWMLILVTLAAIVVSNQYLRKRVSRLEYRVTTLSKMHGLTSEHLNHQ